MSDVFKPATPKPKPVEEKELSGPAESGRVGRTILGGAQSAQHETKTQKKTILGG